MNFSKIGVGQRLVAVLALLMFILIAFFIVDVDFGTKDMTLSIVEKTLSQTTRSVTSTLNRWVENKFLYLDLAATDSGVVEAVKGGDWEKANAWLLEAKKKDPFIESLFVHDVKGDTVLTTNVGGRGKNYGGF